MWTELSSEIHMQNKEYWISHFSSSNQEILSTFLDLKMESCKDILEDLGSPYIDGVNYESAENRVFGFKDVVIKFYRPGRWSLEALEEELLFLEDIRDAGLSFVRPISKVGTWKGVMYIAFEKIQKPYVENRRVLDEQSVREMVHLVAQIHKVGIKRKAISRPCFNPEAMAMGCFEVIKREGFLPKSMHERYRFIIEELIKRIHSFGEIPTQRIHGDTYTGNILWKPSGPVFMDLDDFQVGPVAIDVKLLSFPWRLDSLPEDMDRRERREIQGQMVLKFYREINEFPEEWEKLFPLLSVYRDIQFDAWFCARWRQPGFAKNYENDDITAEKWWQQNIECLEELLVR